MGKDDLSKTLPLCWICGNPANSSEHRLKKADLVRAYRRAPCRGDSAPVHIRAGVPTAIQGPNSSVVKYDQFLCDYCKRPEHNHTIER